MLRKQSGHRKENRKVIITVEGQCEELYFRHLQNLVNNSSCGRNLILEIYVRKPLDQAKRSSNVMLDQPLYHVQDIEDASGGEERVRIRKVVDDLVEAGKKLGIEYRWAYSNISFELWLLLHVKYLTRHMNSARDYFTEMRLAFNRDWANIGQFKKEENFKSILSQYVTLESVTQAVRRAEAIRTRNQENAETFLAYRNHKCCLANPATDVDLLVVHLFRLAGLAL